MRSFCACVLLLGTVLASSAGGTEPEWAGAESPLLTDHIQLTFRTDFVKAGEAYFSGDGRWIIFQAVPIPPEGEAPSPHYSMYVAEVRREADDKITSIGAPIMISEPGSANTCGWFHPEYPWFVLFGSTSTPPKAEDQPGYQRGTSRYSWQFPREMEVVGRRLVSIAMTYPAMRERLGGDVSGRLPPSFKQALPIFRHDGYDAEGSWSPDGKHILYGRMVNPEARDLDLWVYDVEAKTHTALVVAPGYDGGPFWSPDGTWICYRSDRDGNNLLQLFVAEIERDESGNPVGISREIQITDNEHVNWAPYWHPSSVDGRGVLVYATSEVGHRNYEVFAIEVNPDTDPGELRTRRVTHASGFDGLPVFSPDGRTMMWTSQRGPTAEGESRPSSQIWVATVAPGVFETADTLFKATP